MKQFKYGLMIFLAMFLSSCKIDLKGFKSEPKTEKSELNSVASSQVFKRYADYSKINDIGNHRFKRDDSGLVGSGKQISRSIRDLRNEVSSAEAESTPDKAW